MKKITLLMAVFMWSSLFYAQTYLTESFEGGTFPPTGWTDVAGVNDDVLGFTWAASSERSNFGSQAAWFNDFFIVEGEPGTGVNKHRWLITPVMDLSGGTTPELTYYESVKEPGIPAINKVYYSTDYAGDPSTATWVLLNSTIGTEAWAIRGPFALPVNATVYVAFEYEAIFASEWWVDDVLVEETPTCNQPTLASISSITSTSATFSWTPGGSETLWDVELVDITGGGSPTGTPTATGVSNPHVFNSLANGNMYEAYVRADCGGGDTSAWSGPIPFSTGIINDDCSGAISVVHESNIQLPGSATATSGTIDSATDSGETACTGTANNDVWYSFVATSISATIRVESASSDFDPVLEIFSGPCAGLVSIVCVDNNIETEGEETTISGLTVNDTYYVRVHDWFATTPANGNFDLKVYRNIPLDVEDLEVNEFNYYPNPVKDKLNLRAQNNIENISVYNMLGQEVLRLAPNSNSSEIDMSALQTGAYFVRVTINGITETKQIIKR